MFLWLFYEAFMNHCNAMLNSSILCLYFQVQLEEFYFWKKKKKFVIP